MSLPVMEPFAPTLPPSREQSYRSLKSGFHIKNGRTKTIANLEAANEELQSINVPPEGGRDGWFCVLGSFMALFCSFGFLNAIGIFQTHYTQMLPEYSTSDISWIFAVQICLMWLPGPLFGRVIDTFGPGPVLYPSAFLCVFSLCMTSLCTEYYQIFLAQGLGFGIGAGGIFTAAIVSLGQWFGKRRGLAVGLGTVGSSAGGVVFPIFFTRVMKVVGFNGAMRYTALMIGILLVVACILIKARLPPKKWDPETQWFDLSLFNEKEFALYTFGACFIIWGLWAPFDFIPGMAQTIGFSDTLALYLIAIINATSIFGRIVPTHLADKLGHFNVISVCAFLTGASILGLWLPFTLCPHRAGILVFALVYGFVTGAVVSLLMPCVAKSGDINKLGQRFGTFQVLVGLASLTGLPISGAILDRGGSYVGLEVFAGASALLGAMMVVGATIIIGNKRHTRYV